MLPSPQALAATAFSRVGVGSDLIAERRADEAALPAELGRAPGDAQNADDEPVGI